MQVEEAGAAVVRVIKQIVEEGNGAAPVTDALKEGA